MPYIENKDLEDIKNRLFKLEELLKHVKNSPLICGYMGKRLDINDNFNVLTNKKELENIRSRLDALEA